LDSSAVEKPGVLADGPGLEAIHRGVGAAEEGGDAGLVVQVLHALEVGIFSMVSQTISPTGAVERLDRGSVGDVSMSLKFEI
jgi:hypothetical protein